MAARPCLVHFGDDCRDFGRLDVSESILFQVITQYQGGTIMLKVYLYLRNLLENEEGQDLVEYALLAGLISVLLVASMTGVKDAIKVAFNAVISALGGTPVP